MSTSIKPHWSAVKQDISIGTKTAHRRIDYHLATKAISAYNNNSVAAVQTVNKTNSTPTDAVSGPSPGLCDPATVDSVLRWQKLSRVGKGLYNQGNTCFLNSTLQCLIHTAPLAQLLAMDQTKISLRTSENQHPDQMLVTQQYRRVSEEAWSSTGNKAITPRTMAQNIRRVGKQFRVMRQEDAHEYLVQLLDCMHEEVLKCNKVKISTHGKLAETTFINRIFGGYLCNELKCGQCKFSSRTYNHFLDLSLEVSGGGNSSIDQAIKAFIRPEQLTRGNEWSCDGCKRKVQAVKQMTVYKPPKVLVLHLKRFAYGNMQGKINKHIDFAVSLDLPVSAGTDSASVTRVKYELYGVVVHHGGSVHSGHYVAFVKAPNGQWHEMNDCDVTSCSLKTVLAQQAYILFYAQVIAPSPTPAATVSAAAASPPPISTSSSSASVSSGSVQTSMAAGASKIINCLLKGVAGGMSGDDLGEAVATKKSRIERPNETSSQPSSAMTPARAASTPIVTKVSYANDSDCGEDKEDDHSVEEPECSRLPRRQSWLLSPHRFTSAIEKFKKLGKKIKRNIRDVYDNFSEGRMNGRDDACTSADSDSVLQILPRHTALHSHDVPTTGGTMPNAAADDETDTDVSSTELDDHTVNTNGTAPSATASSSSSAPSSLSSVLLLPSSSSAGSGAQAAAVMMRKQSGRAKQAGASEGHWEDLEDCLKTDALRLATQQQEVEQQLLASRQTSDWDKTLDQGRQKKVKKVAAVAVQGGAAPVNFFQAYQSNNKGSSFSPKNKWNGKKNNSNSNHRHSPSRQN